MQRHAPYPPLLCEDPGYTPLFFTEFPHDSRICSPPYSRKYPSSVVPDLAPPFMDPEYPPPTYLKDPYVRCLTD